MIVKITRRRALENSAFAHDSDPVGESHRFHLVYAWVWTALMAYRELTMAVLLASPKNPVLATFIWSQWNGGGLGDAGAAGVMMVAVMSPLVLTLWFFARRQQQIIHSHS